MRTRIHMSLDIEGFLENYKRRKMHGIMTTDEGISLSDWEARQYLKECQAKGWKVLSMVAGPECPDFDHFGGGCPGHTIGEEYTDRELHIAAHMVGVNLYHAIKSTKKKDKKLPKEFYRNYFASGRDGKDLSELRSMVEKGFAEQYNSRETDIMLIFQLTKEGIERFREQFKIIASGESKPKGDEEAKP